MRKCCAWSSNFSSPNISYFYLYKWTINFEIYTLLDLVIFKDFLLNFWLWKRCSLVGKAWDLLLSRILFRFLSIGESRAYSWILAPIAEHTPRSIYQCIPFPKCIENFSIGMPKVPQVGPSVALFIHRSLLGGRVLGILVNRSRLTILLWIFRLFTQPPPYLIPTFHRYVSPAKFNNFQVHE